MFCIANMPECSDTSAVMQRAWSFSSASGSLRSPTIVSIRSLNDSPILRSRTVAWFSCMKRKSGAASRSASL